MALDKINSGTGGEVKLEPTYIDPVSKIRVSQPETLIDTDFEYGLQPTKWETVELVNNIPTYFTRTGDESLPIVSMTVTPGTDIIEVTTSVPHELAVGTPIVVQGTQVTASDGTFIISTVTSTTKFTYKAKQIIDIPGNSVFDTYTTIFAALSYQGTEFKLENLSAIETNGLNPSTLTVTTRAPHGFSQGTSFNLVNSLGVRTTNFNAAAVTPSSFTTSSKTTTTNVVYGADANSYSDYGFNPYDLDGVVNYVLNPATHTLSSNVITCPSAHGLVDGKPYLYTPGIDNTSIGGLTAWKIYHIRTAGNGITNSSTQFYLTTAPFSGTITISSTTMTVVSVTSGTVEVGMVISGGGTVAVTGTWLSSGTPAGSSQITVTSGNVGSLRVGMNLTWTGGNGTFAAGTRITAIAGNNITITPARTAGTNGQALNFTAQGPVGTVLAYGTGVGGTGTYTIDTSQTFVTATAITANQNSAIAITTLTPAGYNNYGYHRFLRATRVTAIDVTNNRFTVDDTVASIGLGVNTPFMVTAPHAGQLSTPALTRSVNNWSTTQYTLYYARVFTGNAFTYATTSGGGNVDITAATNPQTFYLIPVTVLSTSDSFYVTSHGFSSTSIVTYSTNGSPPAGLSNNTDYVAEVIDTNRFRLKSASTGTPISVTTLGTTNAVNTFTSKTYVSTADTIFIPGHTFISGSQITYSNNGNAVPGGMSNGTTYYVFQPTANNFRLATTSTGWTTSDISCVQTAVNVNPTTGIIVTATNHGFTTGRQIYYTSANPVIGLTNGAFYFVRVLSTNSFTVHWSNNGAVTDTERVTITGTPTGTATWREAVFADITSVGSGTQILESPAEIGAGDGIVSIDTIPTPSSFTIPIVSQLQGRTIGINPNTSIIRGGAGLNYYLPGDSTVRTVGTLFRSDTHRLSTGTKLTYNNGGGASIGGLTNGTTYYAIRHSADWFGLATTAENAADKNYIEITSLGSGTTHSFTSATIAGAVPGPGTVGISNESALVAGSGTSLTSYYKTGDIFSILFPTSYIQKSCTVSVATPAVFTSTNHGMKTGAAVIMAAGVAPGGFTNNNIYYVRTTALTTFTLHPTPTDANNNTNGIGASTTGTSVIVNLINPGGSYIDNIKFVSTRAKLETKFPIISHDVPPGTEIINVRNLITNSSSVTVTAVLAGSTSSWSAGDKIVIYGATADTKLNNTTPATWTVGAVSPYTATITQYVIAAGGTSVTATVAATANIWLINDVFTISNANGNAVGLNGTWTVATVPNATTFTFTIVSGTAGTYSGTTIGVTTRPAFTFDISSAITTGSTITTGLGVMSRTKQLLKTGLTYDITTSLLIRADGAAYHRPYDGGVELTPSRNPDSQMIRQTRKYFRYQSGKGLQVSMAINFSPSVLVNRLTASGTVVTGSTRGPHRLSAGLTFRITGAEVPSGFNHYNGDFVVSSIVDDYTFTYDYTSKVTKCRRDIGYLIDGVAWDVALGTNYNAIFLGIAETNSLDISQDVIDRIGDTKNQVLAINSVNANSTAKLRVEQFFTEVLSIVQQGRTAASAHEWTNPTDATTSEIACKDRLLANLNFITSEVNAWVDVNYPANDHNVDKCTRDVKYAVYGFVYDMLYGGNSATYDGAKFFLYAFADGSSGITSAHQGQTVAAYGRLKTIIGQIVRGEAVTRSKGNNRVQVIEGNNATATDATTLEALAQIIGDTIRDNAVPLTVVRNAPSITWAAAGLQTAKADIDSAKTTIQTTLVPAVTSFSVAKGFCFYSVLNWSNSYLRAGMFDDSNGMFYEYDGNEIYCCRRNSTQELSGTVTVQFNSNYVTGINTSFTSQCSTGSKIVIKGQVYKISSILNDNSLTIQPAYRGTDRSNIIAQIVQDTKVPQSRWNLDVCDGSGYTGYKLNKYKIQMAYMDYSWYGAGKIRFGFKTSEGQVQYVHEFIHNNFETEAYLRSGNLPARYEVENVGTPTWVPALAHWGTSVIMDGRFDDDKAYLFTASSTLITQTNASIVTFQGRVTQTGRYDKYTRSGGSFVRSYSNFGYAIEIENASLGPTLNVANGLGITGSNTLQTNTLTALGANLAAFPPYQPNTIISFTGTSRNLMIIDRQPIRTDSAAQAYTITLNTAATLISEFPILSIRLAPSVDNGVPGNLGDREVINRMQLILDSVSVLTTHDVEVYMILNPDLDNNNWQRNIAPSLSQVIYHSLNDTAQFGARIYSFKAQGGSTPPTGQARSAVTTTQALAAVASLGNSIMGGDAAYPDGPDILTLVVKLTADSSTVNATSPFQVSARITWTESQA